jgi:hypothetical protein
MADRELQRIFVADGPHVLLKIEELARTQSDKLLIYYGEEDRPLSYGEINRLANRFGRNLARMGVVKGDRISLSLRGFEGGGDSDGRGTQNVDPGGDAEIHVAEAPPLYRRSAQNADE